MPVRHMTRVWGYNIMGYTSMSNGFAYRPSHRRKSTHTRAQESSLTQRSTVDLPAGISIRDGTYCMCMAQYCTSTCRVT